MLQHDPSIFRDIRRSLSCFHEILSIAIAINRDTSSMPCKYQPSSWPANELSELPPCQEN
jgi:hypothetical protein